LRRQCRQDLLVFQLALEKTSIKLFHDEQKVFYLVSGWYFTVRKKLLFLGADTFIFSKIG